MAKKIVIDAGHGGDDPGASGNGIIEKDKTLQISNYMYDKLRDLGFDVAITRTTDETINPTERVERILAPYGNGSDVIVISNHINAGGADGAEVIYALRNKSTLSDLILENFESKGQNTRKAYQRRLPSNTSKDYYFIHRNTGNTEPIIVEYGFLDSNGDDVNQLKNNWQDLADAVIDALLTYTGKSTEGYYIVKKGDTLYSIARDNNLSVSELKQLNNLTSNTLSVGQRLKIKSDATISPIEPTQPSDTSNIYTVKSGDSLYSIARKYNVTVNDLINYNNLKSNVLSIGQQIRIPSSTTNAGETSSNIYTVKSGDSLYSIARKYNVTVNDLINYNNLKSNVLSIGQQIRIPSSTTNAGETSSNIYTVKSGDSLYSIARKYNVTVNDLMKYNNLTSNLLSIGQQIRIPTSGTSNTYTVKSGDSLYSIAKKYNTTVDRLKSMNNLTSNLLSIGQVLNV